MDSFISTEILLSEIKIKGLSMLSSTDAEKSHALPELKNTVYP